MKVGIFVLALVAAVHADMYLHNPRSVSSLAAASSPKQLSERVESFQSRFFAFLPEGDLTIALTKRTGTGTTQTGKCALK